MAKNKNIEVKGQNISLFTNNAENYVSLTDMARYKDAERTNYIIQNWMRTRSAIEFCGLWELLYNPNFKSIEFDAFKNDSGANSFSLTPQKWIESTGAIGLISKSGRYGGTFAHQDIAFEFASWISAEFKFYFIKEFQRLKTDENDRLNLEWNLQRTLAKINYQIHTDAIKENLIPSQLSKQQITWFMLAKPICLIWHCLEKLHSNGKMIIQIKMEICVITQILNNSLYCRIWKALMP